MVFGMAHLTTGPYHFEQAELDLYILCLINTAPIELFH